jgi:hypothetical protein
VVFAAIIAPSPIVNWFGQYQSIINQQIPLFDILALHSFLPAISKYRKWIT